MAFSNHRDPVFYAVLGWQRRDRKRNMGCGSCLFRGEKLWGKYTCGRGEEPGVKGYCKLWYGDEREGQEKG